jgi:trigger factor
MSLQVTDKSSEGLSRIIGVTVPAADLNTKLDAKIREMAPQMKLRGFRPGKVPAAHVRKMYGRDLMREIVQDALKEGSDKALGDAQLRAASQPELKMISDAEKVVAGRGSRLRNRAGGDARFTPVTSPACSSPGRLYEPSDAAWTPR